MELLPPKQLKRLHFGITNNLPVSVKKQSTGVYETILPNNTLYLKDITSPTYHHQRINTITECLTNTLNNSKYASMKEAENSLEVKTTKDFIRRFKKEQGAEPCTKILCRQLLASRLAIPVTAFDHNPGFYEFASKNFLYHYMRTYDHHLKVDPKTYEIHILSENKWKAWSEVKDIVTKPLPKRPGQPTQPWVYGPKGVQNKDMYNWTTLTPFKYDDPKKWSYQWILEVCACNESSPQKNGDHSWFRLKTPTGEIYSIGLYRPGKNGLLDNLKEPFRIKKGHLMMPDLSEYYPCNINSFEYKIDEKIFNQIKSLVEQDKKRDKELFQAIGMNCTQYVNKIASIAGIKLPTQKRIWRIVTPKPLEKSITWTAKYTPSFIKKICDFITALFVNGLLICLGATKKDKRVVNEVGKSVNPHINSVRDVFDPNKASLHHPHTLGHDVCNRIKKWRQQSIKSENLKLQEMLKLPNVESQTQQSKIKHIQERIKLIPFDVPDDFKVAMLHNSNHRANHQCYTEVSSKFG